MLDKLNTYIKSLPVSYDYVVLASAFLIVALLSFLFEPHYGIYSRAHHDKIHRSSIPISKVVKSALYAKKQYDKIHHIKSPVNVIIVDMRLPSNIPRLFVVDTNTHKKILSTYVAHGINSGMGFMAHSFSNAIGSKETSLGIYRTGMHYYGRHGNTIKLYGMEKGYNDNAFIRDIVMHTSAYADSAGHSWGCLAVPMNIKSRLWALIEPHTLVLVIGNNYNWLKSTKYFKE